MNTYDDCTFCGGRVIETRGQKTCFWGDKLIAIIDNVPTGVCNQCGEKYYKSRVLKQVEDMLKERRGFLSVAIPMAEFADVV